MPETFRRVVEASMITEGTLLSFLVNGWPLLLCRDDGTLYALINRCPHAGAPLAPDGRVRRGTVTCPLHGARFRLDSGECTGTAPHKPLRMFPWRETADGWIEVAIPDAAPGAEHFPIYP